MAQTPKAQIVWILSGSMLLSVGLYFGIAALLSPAEQTPATHSLAPMLAVVALAAVGASFWFRHRFFAQPTPGQRFAALIIALALCQLAAVLGLVVRFVENAPEYWTFFLFGALGIALHYPRAD